MPALRADKVAHSVSLAELRFARRSARYLADEGLTPAEVRDALMEHLDLPVHVAESIVCRLATGASLNPSMTTAA